VFDKQLSRCIGAREDKRNSRIQQLLASISSNAIWPQAKLMRSLASCQCAEKTYPRVMYSNSVAPLWVLAGGDAFDPFFAGSHLLLRHHYIFPFIADFAQY